jgi:hypothetical protein
MKAAITICAYKSVASALLMLLALLWLTVSTPFVYACQQQLAAAAQNEGAAKAAQSNNPLAGTDEEKPGLGSSNVSEYLHQTELASRAVRPLVKYEKCNASNLYLAFHPELLCPPPNTVG